MARSYVEAQSLRDKFKAAGVPLFVCRPRIVLPRMIAAKRLIYAKGIIGKITSVTYKLARSDHIKGGGRQGEAVVAPLKGWRGDVEKSGGGLFMEFGCQSLSIIEYLVGNISRVAGDAARASGIPHQSPESSVVMSFRAGGRYGLGAAASSSSSSSSSSSHRRAIVGEEGVLGTASFNFAAAVHEDRLCVEGTKGTLDMSLFGEEPPMITVAGGKQVHYPFKNPEVLHLPMMQRVVDYLHGCPMLDEVQHSAENGVRLLNVADAALRTFYRARDDHFWKRRHTWL